MNSRKAIQDIKGKIEVMQEEGGTRNWTGWEQLQRDLGEEYRRKKFIGLKNSKFNGLQREIKI